MVEQIVTKFPLLKIVILCVPVIFSGCMLNDRELNEVDNKTIQSEGRFGVHVNRSAVELARLNTCAWQGPYVADLPGRNLALLDAGAAYWSFFGTLPEGAKVYIEGEYPRARYFSLNSYRMDGSTGPYHSLIDKDIAPLAGRPPNPYLTGALRHTKSKYRVELKFDDDHDSENNRISENQLLVDLFEESDYQAKVKSDPLGVFPTFSSDVDGFQLIYRIYMHDSDVNAAGGIELPRVHVELDGKLISDQTEVCALLKAKKEVVESTLMDPESQYGHLLKIGNPYTAKGYFNNEGDSDPDPDIIWRKSFSQGHNMRCIWLGNCEYSGEGRSGFYGNNDNAYLSAWVDRRRGEVVITRAKTPITPMTIGGNKRFEDGDAELRYWSMCSYEFYSQRVVDCIFDEQLLLDSKRVYAIVLSKKEDRPANATEECGYNWLKFSEYGDNYALSHQNEHKSEYSNNLHDAVLINRWMLAYPGASNKTQLSSVSQPGLERRVLQEYYPESQYVSKEAFERLPCRKAH